MIDDCPLEEVVWIAETAWALTLTVPQVTILTNAL